MEQPKTFGEYVRATRIERGETLRQLESRCGIPNPTLSRIEDGGIAMPTPDRFMLLVDALELNLITAIKLIPAYRRMYERIIATIQTGETND